MAQSTSNGSQAEEQFDAGMERASELAQDARERAVDFSKRAKEWVIEHPTASVVGAVVAGWLLAKLVSRND